MHDALDGFFKAMRVASGGAPVLMREPDVARSTPLLVDAFEQAWAAQIGRAWLGDRALYGVVRAELLHLLTRYVKLEAHGVRFRFDGKIDRVDAIDYKSSIYSTPASGNKKGWDDGVVLQVPLYAKALAKVRPDLTLARLEYRSLRPPGPVHTLDLLKPAKPANPKRPEAVAPDVVEDATGVLVFSGCAGP